MIAKKKSKPSATVVEEAPSTLEESMEKEERKSSPVTQVVEVVEDSSSLEDSTSLETQANDLLEHSVKTQPEPSVTHTAKDSDQEDVRVDIDDSDEKRKVLVDELFQKKKQVPEAGVMPEISAHHSQKKNPIVYWAIGIVSACVVIGVSMVLFSGKKLSMPSLVVVPTSTPTVASSTPTPTSAEVKKDAVTIQVLNGGGKAGAATRMKKLLEEKGYTVKDTGNTEEYTYDKTEVHTKATKKEYLSLVEGDLSGDYSMGTSAADLEESVAYDIRVIVGSEE